MNKILLIITTAPNLLLAEQIAKDEEAARKAQEELDKQLESQITETEAPVIYVPTINVHQ